MAQESTLTAPNERPFVLPKDVLDTANSVCWFFADAFWMLESPRLAYSLIVPTILTGLCLLYVEKRLSVIFINAAINFWIWMNTSWMVADMEAIPELMPVSKACLLGGIVCISLAIFTSKSLMDTFSHFRRFRVLKW